MIITEDSLSLYLSKDISTKLPTLNKEHGCTFKGDNCQNCFLSFWKGDYA